MLPGNIRILKANQYNYDTTGTELALMPKKMPYSVIIKRFQIDYSLEQKYRLGIMTPPEYAQWVQEKEEELRAQNKPPKKERKNHTFWEDDGGERKNVSENDFAKFLSENSLDVSNTTAVDVAALIQQENEKVLDSVGFETTQDSIAVILESAEAEKRQEEEILAAAMGGNADDENRVLSPEEIAALFEKMGTN